MVDAHVFGQGAAAYCAIVSCLQQKQELSKPRLATPLHAYVLVTHLLKRYLGTYLFTRLLASRL